MSLLKLSAAHTRESFPRVSGDEPVEAGVLDRGQRFSPRERG